MSKHLPTDLFKIITSFAWGKKIPYKDLERQLHHAQDIQDSVSPLLLNPVVFDYKLGRHVPSPYKSCFPFHPLCDIDRATIWSEISSLLPNVLTQEFFKRIKSYRNVFRRYIERMRVSGFHAYNILLFKFFDHIRQHDFVFEDLNLISIVEELRLCQQSAC